MKKTGMATRRVAGLAAAIVLLAGGGLMATGCGGDDTETTQRTDRPGRQGADETAEVGRTDDQADGTLASEEQPDRHGETGERDQVTAEDLAREEPMVSEESVEREGDRTRYSLAFPTGERESSALLIEKSMPERALAGELVDYSIQVTNLTDAPLADVWVAEAMYGGVEFDSSQPQGQPSPDAPQDVRWQVGMMEPGESRTIDVRAVAREPGKNLTCVTAGYAPALCAIMQVVDPELEVSKAGPDMIYACEELTWNYRVTNQGTGSAREVVVRDELPEGLETTDGDRIVVQEIGDLSAGETREFSAALRPTSPGEFGSRAVAESQTSRSASERVTTRVVEPQLDLRVSGPEYAYPGRPTTFTVEVTNNGEAPAREVTVLLETPDLDRDPEPRRIDQIEPGNTRSFNVTLEAREPQQLRLAARTESFCAREAEDTIVTAVRGLPALLVEVVDERDPIPAGENTVYALTVENQGSAEATNVRLRADVPEGMSFVDARGASQVDESGGQLAFEPIDRLGPGDVEVWHLLMRGDDPGNKRFRVEVLSDFLERPVPTVEPTRVIAAGQAPEQDQPRYGSGSDQQWWQSYDDEQLDRDRQPDQDRSRYQQRPQRPRAQDPDPWWREYQGRGSQESGGGR
ncbi:MAG: NEW3 domain-containing protein [Candidatus Krumholzibacteriia bacterium]